jgi:hypothetical protein
MELQDGSMLAFFIPWLAKWFPRLSGWKTYLNDANVVFDFWKNYSRQRLETYDLGKEIRRDNFVDQYIRKIKDCDDPSSSFYREKGGKKECERQCNGSF